MIINWTCLSPLNNVVRHSIGICDQMSRDYDHKINPVNQYLIIIVNPCMNVINETRGESRIFQAWVHPRKCIKWESIRT